MPIAVKWLLYIFVALLALIVLIALLGLLLPKAHRATRMVRLHQPPELIFAAITGPQEWRPGIVRTEIHNPGGPRRWSEKTRRGAITFEEAASEPPRLFRSRIADPNLPFSGTWTYEIAATTVGGAPGCTCRITEDGEVSNPIFRVIGRFVIGHTRTIDEYLTALCRKFNEPATLEN